MPVKPETVKSTEKPRRFDPSDNKVHVVKNDRRDGAPLTLCGKTGQTHVSSASGWWGPRGQRLARGLPRVSPSGVQARGADGSATRSFVVKPIASLCCHEVMTPETAHDVRKVSAFGNSLAHAACVKADGRRF